MAPNQQGVGEMLRMWRERRRYSQLGLAMEAEISQRHLSFLESGRSRPSRDMVVRLTEYLDVPLRERNAMLLAAGFAPAYGEHALSAPELTVARETIQRILTGHHPHPALAVDRHWTLFAANEALALFTSGVAPHLLEGTVNALRLSFHPDGMAPRIANFGEWRRHVLARLTHDIAVSADQQLISLREELASYPVPRDAAETDAEEVPAQCPAIPLVLKSPDGPLAFLSTTTVFGTAVDVTLADVTIESFFPADPHTAATMARLAQQLDVS